MGLELKSLDLLFLVLYNSAQTCLKSYSLACIARAMVRVSFCCTSSCDSEKLTLSAIECRHSPARCSSLGLRYCSITSTTSG